MLRAAPRVRQRPWPHRHWSAQSRTAQRAVLGCCGVRSHCARPRRGRVWRMFVVKYVQRLWLVRVGAPEALLLLSLSPALPRPHLQAPRLQMENKRQHLPQAVLRTRALTVAACQGQPAVRRLRPVRNLGSGALAQRLAWQTMPGVALAEKARRRQLRLLQKLGVWLRARQHRPLAFDAHSAPALACVNRIRQPETSSFLQKLI